MAWWKGWWPAAAHRSCCTPQMNRQVNSHSDSAMMTAPETLCRYYYWIRLPIHSDTLKWGSFLFSLCFFSTYFVLFFFLFHFAEKPDNVPNAKLDVGRMTIFTWNELMLRPNFSKIL